MIKTIMENSFYLTLSSDKSRIVADIPDDINVDDTWSIALTDYSVPKTWGNVYEDQEIELLVYNPNKPDYIKVIKNDIVIPKGDYSIKELVNEINSKLQEFIIEGTLLGTYKTSIATPKLVGDYSLLFYHGLLSGEERYFVRFPHILSNMLGFPRKDMEKLAKNTFSLYKCSDKLNAGQPYQKTPDTFCTSIDVNLDRNLSLLTVKSDICIGHYTNTLDKNLLKFIHVNSSTKWGDNIRDEKHDRQYIPVVPDKTQFEIEILSNGKELAFDHGKLVLTLHFKKNELSKIDMEPLAEGELPDYSKPGKSILELISEGLQ